jgi:hypothetical protein
MTKKIELFKETGSVYYWARLCSPTTSCLFSTGQGSEGGLEEDLEFQLNKILRLKEL